MAETLPQTAEKTWSNPEQIAFIVNEVKYQKEISRVDVVDPYDDTAIANGEFAIRHRGHAVGASVIRIASHRKIADFASNFEDSYLRMGIVDLYEQWEPIGDYLLTPKNVREPIHSGGWDYVQGCVGAVCLAARAADTEVAVDFNGIALTATPETLPQDLHQQYLDTMNAKHLAAQASV